MAAKDSLAIRVIHYSLVLVIVCTAASISLGYIYAAARPEIDKNEARRQALDLQELFPEEGAAFAEKTGKNGDKEITYTAVTLKDKLLGYAVVGEGKGYSSTIKVMVRVDAALTRVERVKVSSSSETPGLGERIKEIKSENTLVRSLMGQKKDESGLRPWFQDQFAGKAVDQLVVVKSAEKKGILAISGATVSSRGTTMAVLDGISKLKTALGK